MKNQIPIFLTVLVLFSISGILTIAGAQEVIPYEIQIENTHNTIQGSHEEVSVTLNKGSEDLLGFDLMIAYDNTALSFAGADQGEIFAECGWEYFNYRFGANGNCNNACPASLLRVVGLAETNNGDIHPTCYSPSTLPSELFSLDFLVTNDYTFECQFAPIQFFWVDCGDNAISYNSSDNPAYIVQTLAVSREIYEPAFSNENIANGNYGFPTYFGAQDTCLVPDGTGRPAPTRLIDFINGGVSIICYDTIDDRGDINLNGLPYELADWELFQYYFLHGLGVFTVNPAGQILATDINKDGETLKLEDLAQILNIVNGDMTPDETVDQTVQSGTYIVNDQEIRAVKTYLESPVHIFWLVFDGEVTPGNLGQNVTLDYTFDGSVTRMLVFDSSNLTDSAFTLFDYTGDGYIINSQAANNAGVEYLVSVTNCGALVPCDQPAYFGDINLNGLECEISDFILFSFYLTHGIDEAFIIDPETQLFNTDVNQDGLTGTVEDLVFMHRGINGDGPFSEHFDSTSPNIATFTQRTDPSRSSESFIDLETLDSIGAVQLIFAGDITITTSNSSATADYYYQNGQTTVLVYVSLEYSLDSVFIESGQLLSYTGTGELIIARAATYTGVKINSNIDFASDVGDNNLDNLPGEFVLHQNYPNPFNNSTVINFDLPRVSQVRLEIINLLGQTVYRIERHYSVGSHSFLWDGIDNNGTIVSSGVYYYRIIAGDFVESKKMILLK